MAEIFLEFGKGGSRPIAAFGNSDDDQPRGWTVISMKQDWKVIYPFENK